MAVPTDLARVRVRLTNKSLDQRTVSVTDERGWSGGARALGGVQGMCAQTPRSSVWVVQPGIVSVQVAGEAAARKVRAERGKLTEVVVP